jgi:hypothetical protein
VVSHVRRPAHKAEASEQAKTEETEAAEKRSGAKGSENATPPDKTKTGENERPADNQGSPAEKSTAQEAPPAPGKRHGRKGAAEAKSKDQSSAVQEAIASGDPDAIEKAKYDELKTHAADDPHVKELKQKADTAPTEDEGRKASRSYYKALFEKMRSLDDGSAHERIERMETAVMKDLGG